MPSGKVEKVAVCFVKRELEGVVLYPSGSGDEIERTQSFGDGLQFV
jgi:hypothetical protein